MGYAPQSYGGYVQSRPKVGTGKMVLVIVGGVMALLAPFMLFFVSASSGGASSADFVSLTKATYNDYAYGWLMAIGGILGIVLAIVAFATQKHLFATIAGLCGILSIIIPIALAADLSSSNRSIVEVFFFSDSVDTSYYSYSMSSIYVGGIMAIIGGVVILIGGFMMAGSLKRAQPMAPAYQQAPVYQQPAPQYQQAAPQHYQQAPTQQYQQAPPQQYQQPPPQQYKQAPPPQIMCAGCGQPLQAGFAVCPNCGRPAR